MDRLTVDYFLSWPFDEALTWMSNAHLLVKQNPERIFLGCGFHAEKVITLGRNPKLNDRSSISDASDCLVRTLDRGGGMTAHEPGQIVLYPVMSLKKYRIEIPDLIFLLEEAMISFLLDLAIVAERSSLDHGVFIGDKKVGFLGLRIDDGITRHGIALNLSNDAAIFSRFSPCGNPKLEVTSAIRHGHVPQSPASSLSTFTEHFTRQMAAFINLGEL